VPGCRSPLFNTRILAPGESNVTIKAIETEYNGYRFRSRLEARWAVFFDTLGIKYQYEMEGYDTKEGYYLPDFRLPKYNALIEIKPDHPKQAELSKIEDAALQSEHLPVLIEGVPGDETMWLYLDDMKDSSAGTQWWTDFKWFDIQGDIKFWHDKELYVTGEVRRYLYYPSFLANIRPICPGFITTFFGGGAPIVPHSDLVNMAYSEARAARFEHRNSNAR